ncbi:hypothetical protein V1478_014754, partial [Vespula squamosa]
PGCFIVGRGPSGALRVKERRKKTCDGSDGSEKRREEKRREEKRREEKRRLEKLRRREAEGGRGKEEEEGGGEGGGEGEGIVRCVGPQWRTLPLRKLFATILLHDFYSNLEPKGSHEENKKKKKRENRQAFRSSHAGYRTISRGHPLAMNRDVIYA